MGDELNDAALKLSQACVGGSDIHKWDVPCVSGGEGGLLMEVAFTRNMPRRFIAQFASRTLAMYTPASEIKSMQVGR
jgi:hypothetical protein